MTHTAPPPPPAVDELPYGTQLVVGPGVSTVLADFDFETYSEAGYIWDAEADKWVGPRGAAPGKKGLPQVGAANYSQHPSAEVLWLAYDLKDGRGKRRWRPGLELPVDLFVHLAEGRLIEAWNSGFERWIWDNVCMPKYGFPALPHDQLRCAMAKARAFSLPPGLEDAAGVMNTLRKDPAGKPLMDKFSMPRNPTKKDPRTRIMPEDEPEDFERYGKYNDRDIQAEAMISARVPDLIPSELAFWQADQAINRRGTGVDMQTVRACADLIDQLAERYDAELAQITNGVVTAATQTARMSTWLQTVYGIVMTSMDEDAVADALEHDAPKWEAPARRLLEIRALAGSASIKKVFAMLRYATPAGRIHDMFTFHGARTGRDTHADVQPGNLPKAGPDIVWCAQGHAYGAHATACPWCQDAARNELSPGGEKGWTPEAVPFAINVLRTRDLNTVQHYFGDAQRTIAGCVRSMIVAADGHELVCSDYSSIEAVVTACISGEQWRIDAFRRKEDIYLHGAAAITGKSYEWYQANGGKKHPDRNKIGKPGELGLGFGGWVNAWRNFGGEGTDDEIKAKIVPWRAASPMVVEMWGGQVRGKPWNPDSVELYGLEGMAIAATQNPGQAFTYRCATYQVVDDVLYCWLPSGRTLKYHRPRLARSTRWDGQLSLSFEGWKTSQERGGQRGWCRMDTYGGKLFENYVQAVARDVMAHAVVLAEKRGYPIVLRVHDELAAEVPVGWGSIEEFEAIMTDLPDWCRDWPIRAAGGWRNVRYRKD